MLLNEAEIITQLKRFPDWEFEQNALIKEFTNSSFSASLAFVIAVGIEAEKINHHPDILIHSWNKVKISISTHSKKGVTEKDFTLLEKIENIKL